VIPLPVVTDRLVIDRLVTGDAAAVVDYRKDPGTARFQGWALPYTTEEAERLASSGQLALRVTEALAGDAMLEPVPGSIREAELGITLAPAWRGQGLAREAVIALTDAAFAAGLTKLVAYVDVRNGRSLRLFDRLGFRREGLVHHVEPGGEGPSDEVLFGLTADVWRRADSTLTVELEPHPADVARLEAELYGFNVAAVGRADGTELAVFERDDLGRIAGGVAGVVWAGGAELRQLWVRADRRGGGLGRRLVAAFEAGARARGAAKVFVSSHSFQAPGLYEHLGYRATGRWDGYPAGHAQVFLEKDLG
jgi:RimJ/RimL family protein N-acetyltransferase